MPDLAVLDDPFNTALDRAVAAAGYAGGIQFNATCDAIEWNRLSPADRVDLTLYWQAINANLQWDEMLRRQQSRTRSAWSLVAGWHRVPWTDTEKAAERDAFQGRA